MKNEEKEYIYWSNRKLSYNNKLTDYKKLQDNLKLLVHFLYNLYYGKSYTFNIK